MGEDGEGRMVQRLGSRAVDQARRDSWIETAVMHTDAAKAGGRRCRRLRDSTGQSVAVFSSAKELHSRARPRIRDLLISRRQN